MKKVGVAIHAIDNFNVDLIKGLKDIDYIHVDVMDGKFVNNTMNFHPMHVHGVMFQVYSRNGNANLNPKDKAWIAIGEIGLFFLA